MFFTKLKRQFKWYLLSGVLLWVSYFVFNADGKIPPVSWVIVMLTLSLLAYSVAVCLIGVFRLLKHVVRYFLNSR